ncbi:hypothetical protein [Cyclobacterium plantarum]|uniref:Uncharacterized protein n=1 Tax=Cyclobacterium plantarum TaxID=2716263 RepID=A0ABX0H6B7_9BACT|nr:hypothetical protein [Cyclobacterium plantarum]NHE55786.1 hypothetical protein [Cyclobacterium plantarum]
MEIQFEWATQKVEFYSELFDTKTVNKGYFHHIYGFAKSVLGEKIIPIELVATFRQSSFIYHRKNQSAIFFDLGQSFLLKSIFKTIASGAGFSALVEIFKQSACLYIVTQDYNFASLLSKHPLVPFQKYYSCKEDDLAFYGNIMSRYKEVLQSTEFYKIVDNFIIGHEIFHYLSHRKHSVEWFKRSSDEYFEDALNQCCYEQRGDFAEIASYYGRIKLSKESLEKIRSDLASRRIDYIARKEDLTKEIECDLFAFTYMTRFICKDQEKSIDSVLFFCKLFYILFCIFDLHFAINRRFLLSIRSSISCTKPPDIADINFRKVALVEIIWNHIYNNVLLRNGVNNKEINSLYVKFREDIFNFKAAIDNLYLIPITNAFYDMLENGERIKDSIPKKQVHNFHIKNFAERIIERDDVFNLQDHENAFY